MTVQLTYTAYGWNNLRRRLIMENNFITRNEHTEFVKRMEGEHDRQNHRLNNLELAVEKFGSLTVSVEKMAVSMELMLKEQKRLSESVEELEAHDGDMWRKVTAYAATAVLGIVIGYLFKKLGM